MSNWKEITIKTTTEAVEPINNILFENGVGGVQIEDPKDFLFQDKKSYEWDYVDESVINKSKVDFVKIKTYIPENKNIPEFITVISEKIKNLKSFGIDIGEFSVETDDVLESDWANNWKKYYKPTRVGEKIVIKPKWEDYTEKPGDVILELNPGRAFGTGTHETTSMCICELEKYVKNESVVYDIGCGSGILAITAAKLNAKKILAVDIDEIAVEVAKENAKENGVLEKIDIFKGDLADKISKDQKADVIVANIMADIIIYLSAYIQDFMKDNGVFISSGIILEKVEEVKMALEKNGFEIISINRKKEWAVIVSTIAK